MVVTCATTAFFVGTDGTDGEQLWKTGGTDAGTMRVTDVTESTRPFWELTGMGGAVYYSVNAGGPNDFELWRSDGTAGGTSKVKDTITNGEGSSPRNLTVMNDVLYFAADDGATGVELWRSDGVRDGSGTRRVSDINEGIDSSNPSSLFALDGARYFVAASENAGYAAVLWKSSGTAETTSVVKDSAGVEIEAGNLTVPNGALYFSGRSEAVAGIEPWISDGAPAGARMLKDINTTAYTASYPSDFTLVNGAVLFAAADGGTKELWKTDGTTDHTVKMKDATGAPVEFVDFRRLP